MKKRVINLRPANQSPLLDIVTYARGRTITPAQRAYIARTVRRVPEVLVKVSGGARTLTGVQRHMKYIEKKGELGLETDMGTRAGGEHFSSRMVEDWDLDIEALKHYSKRFVRGKPPKLVHNIIFSMPPGTSAKKVLMAVRKLALNEWALQHRFAMALHIDEPHPHVHVVVKAVSEQGIRLNIKKATLRTWRAQFAANLRELGVAANATERAVRGETRIHKKTAIYRAALRDASSHMRKRRLEVHKSAAIGSQSTDPGYAVMNRTRQYVIAGWRALVAGLTAGGEEELARDVAQFVDRMPSVQTENAMLAAQMLHATRRSRTGPAELSL
jgi:type IV secretory pathway VirD2 relaxase